MAELILVASYYEVDVSHWIRVLKRMAQFLQIPVNRMSIRPVKHYKIKTNIEYTVLAMGPGNSLRYSSTQGVELLWYLPCGVISEMNSFTKILQHNVIEGRIPSIIGHDISKWVSVPSAVSQSSTTPSFTIPSSTTPSSTTPSAITDLLAAATFSQYKNRIFFNISEFSAPSNIRRPSLDNPLKKLHARIGHYFHYIVPENTFSDTTDGGTRRLTLLLKDGNYRNLTKQSWIQFNESSQTMIGLPLDSVLINEVQQFILIATNSQRLTVADAFVISINASNFRDFNHKFSVKFNTTYDLFVRRQVNLLRLISRLALYFGDSDPSALVVNSLKRGSVELNFSNGSVSTNTCDQVALDNLISLLIYKNGTVNKKFISEMAPEYPVMGVKVIKLGNCVASTASPIINPEDSDNPTVAIIVPIIIVILVIVMIVILMICLHRRREQKGRLLFGYEERRTYNPDRKPVLMPYDCDPASVGGAPYKPRRPLTFDNEVFEAEMAPRITSQTQPPSRPDPPSYNIPLDDLDGGRTSAVPPGSFSDLPPPYRIPPPYIENTNA
ncbi:uncharacterized protein LOC141901246 [Tubulanus polymorphus]|uniref:uncharacterized protein LOC141901246 n=1 Tax=Tubulanus polymorphus TaxID=672921 RepID=UPI003DA31D09